MASSIIGSIEKLKGRENYSSWKFAVTAYLQHENLWKVVTGAEADEEKCGKARAKIILLLDPINYVHVQDADTAKEAWEKLEKAFDDSGVYRKVGLLRKLITTRLDECGSTEKYVNEIIMTSHRLRSIKFDVSDEWIGALLLAGLPESYEPMIMAIESSGVKITADDIKSRLLQKVKVAASTGVDVVLVNKKSVKKRPWNKCYSCNQYGHFANKCPNKSSAGSKKDDKKATTMFSAFVCSSNSNQWFIDSGASAHMVNKREMFVEISGASNLEVVGANNSSMKVEGMGDVNVDVSINGEVQTNLVQNALLVPDLCANLISVSQLVKGGKKVVFDDTGCKVLSGTSIIATAKLENGLFAMDQPQSVSFVSSAIKKDESTLWHRRMGHISYSSLRKLPHVTEINVKDPLTENKDCSICVMGKQSRMPFNDSETRAKCILEIVHSDLCGPFEIPSLSGGRYLMVVVDDFSRKVFVNILKTKSECFEKFEDFKNCVEKQTDKKIKILRTDNGTEFCNSKFDGFLRRHGIVHQTTAPYTPEQNGVAERMNRTLVEKTRCLLFDANLEKLFWGEAICTAAYLVNRSPCRSINGKTPEELWRGVKPNLSNVRVFGCRALAHVPKQKRRKLDSKSEECFLLGYCEQSKAYRLYNPSTESIVISRDVVFFEDQRLGNQVSIRSDKTNFFDLFTDEQISETPLGEIVEGDASAPISSDVTDEREVVAEDLSVVENTAAGSLNLLDSSSGSSFESCNDDSSNQESDGDEYVPPRPIVETIQEARRSERAPKPRQMDDFVTYNVLTNDSSDPVKFTEIADRSDRNSWNKAMEEEFQCLIKNNTWKLVNLPPGKRVIPCKWVYKTKRDSTGKIVRYKARLVIMGCAQTKGVDYEETYSPVVRYTSIRMLLGFAVKFDLDIDQLDVVTAFLHGDLEEEIYMYQPDGYTTGDKVCLLKKALYGLKQASRSWNRKLDGELKKFGLIQSLLDPCVYYWREDTKMLFLVVYVDDMLIFSNDTNMKQKLKTTLKDAFEVKDLGEARFVLGMEIERDRKNGKLWVNQQLYINNLLDKYNMSQCNPVKTPLDINVKLNSEMCPTSDEEKRKMAAIPYQESVGSILYAVQVSRPDLSFAISLVSRFNQNPGFAHWNAVKRIMRYLRGTSDAKLEFNKSNCERIVGYCDADWGSEMDGRRSVSGYVFQFQGGPISWNARRQPTVALSTCEAEFMSLTAAVQESMWLESLYKELSPATEQSIFLPTINCDNKSAIDFSKTTCYKARSKHIDIKYHFVRDMVDEGKINLQYIRTKDMLADVLTKGLAGEKHYHCCRGMGVKFKSN